ncbi:MAG TPA: GNAT family N-acetyltransferase [Candidatus Limnocylindrales bacterium]|nr:GNAT family N-acetyltransferase [Candidatus Limnocylindrales bacterium]
MKPLIRAAETDADLEAWRRVRLAVIPDERAMSVAEMRATTDDALYVLAELDGDVVGSGSSGRSSFDYAGLHVRVVPASRRMGVGSAVLRTLAEHAVERGFTEAGSIVEDAGSLAFAERFGFHEVDRQIEQVRSIGDEPRPAVPDGIRIVTAAERPELWAQAFDPFALEAIGDMATHLPVVVTPEEWQAEWLVWPEAMFLALEGDEIVGCAGLEFDPDRPDRSEHAFTGVARRWRRRGLASVLKRLTLRFAAEHAIREVYTWTQRGNADMRVLNERLGYRYGKEAITIRASLPLRRASEDPPATT